MSSKLPSFLIGWCLICAPLFFVQGSEIGYQGTQNKSDQSDYFADAIKLIKERAESNPDSGLIVSRKLLREADQLANDSIKAQVLIALSTSHSFLAAYDSSTYYAFEALKLAEVFKDTMTIIDAFNNLGIDFMFQEEDEKAIDYFRKVEDLAKAFRDSLRWGHAINNLGMMYGYAGKSQDELNNYQQAARIFLHIGEKEGYANTLLNTGTVFTQLEEFDKADRYYREALDAFEEIGLASGIQNTLQSASENALASGKLDVSEQMAKKALVLAEESQFLQDVIYTSDLLTQIALKRGDYAAAYRYQQKHYEQKERVFNAEKSKQVSELEEKYESEKKEQQLELNRLELLKNEREQWALIGAIITLFLVSGFIIFMIRYQSRLKSKLLIEEVDNLRLKIGTLLGEQVADLDKNAIDQQLFKPLTDREFEVLNLTASDYTNQEIADKVFVSVNTVKFHLKNIYEKLGVSNRKEAINLVIGQS